MTNGSLRKSKVLFCNTFDLQLAINGIENHFSVFMRVAVLHRFYCNVACFLLFAVLFFKIKLNFQKNSLKHTVRMSNNFKIKPTFSEVTYIKNIRFSLLEIKYMTFFYD